MKVRGLSQPVYNVDIVPGRGVGIEPIFDSISTKQVEIQD
jgi:hypothetical protein